MMALIAWASDAGPASARQGSRSERPAPPACGLDRLPTSRRFAAKRSWLVVSASAHFANQLRITASWSDVAWTSVVLWISQACHSRAMARSHKPCRRHALTETSFDDLYDYVPTRDHPRQRETRRASATWKVTVALLYPYRAQNRPGTRGDHGMEHPLLGTGRECSPQHPAN